MAQRWSGQRHHYSLKPSAVIVCQGPINITAHHKTYGERKSGQRDESSTEKVCKVNAWRQKLACHPALLITNPVKMLN